MPVADLGMDVVSRLRRHRTCADLEIVEWPRGWTCVRDGVTQHVWSEPASAGRQSTSWRVNLRSDLMVGFEGKAAQLAALGLDMESSTLGAIVRSRVDEKALQFASSLRVHRGNEAWVTELLAALMQFHAWEVRRLLRSSELVLLGASPDGPAAPGYDGSTDVGAAGPGPFGVFRPPAQVDLETWKGELQFSAEVLRAVPGVRAAATPRGLTASFALAAGRLQGLALLELDVQAQRPPLGSGFSAVLVPPARGGVMDALKLNEQELMPGCRTDLVGSWSAREGVLQHAAFFPAGLVQSRTLPTEIALGALLRVEWLAATMLS
jgi:hypothetical protein